MRYVARHKSRAAGPASPPACEVLGIIKRSFGRFIIPPVFSGTPTPNSSIQ
jgi:hypothetical protein